MTNMTNKIVISGVVLALLLSVGAYFHSGKSGPQGPQGPDGLGAQAQGLQDGNDLHNLVIILLRDLELWLRLVLQHIQILAQSTSTCLAPSHST